MRRLLTALVGAPILWAIIKLGSPLVWFVLAAVVIGFASRELLSLLEKGGHRVYRATGVFFSIVVLVSFAHPRIDPALPVVAAGGAAVILGAIRARDFTEAVDGALCTVFCVAFVGLNLGYIGALRAMSYGTDPGGAGWSGVAPVGLRFAASEADALGQDLLILLLIVVWFGDTAAYYLGRMFGRTPLAPRVSPKKTVEGAIGGIAAAVGAGILASIWFFQKLPLGHAVALGLLLGIAGIVGDLAESVIKRASGAKDSAAILPGHGGVLDRVDSLLLAGPALYYYHRALLSGVL